MADHVYVVAAGPETRARIADVLSEQSPAVTPFESVASLLDVVDAQACGCIVVAADLPNAGARHLIDEVRLRRIDMAVVVVGCDDDFRAAVDFVRGGAHEFVEYPMRAGRLKAAVRRALAAVRRSTARDD